jgi:hypothetical protein
MLGKKGAGKERAGEETGRSGKQPLPEDRVRLRPILGIRPGHYLAALYSFIILGILFLVLLYPGISRPGSLAALNSEPQGAAIRVDGVYRAGTPARVFIPRGARTIEFVLPGYKPHRIETEIPGRIFGSLVVPRRVAITGTLESLSPWEPLRLGAAEYAAWSFAGEPTATYQIPRSLSEGAYRAGPATAFHDDLEGILDGALRFATTRAALRDLVRAEFLIDTGGLSPSPLTLAGSARDMLERLSETPGAAVWLVDLLLGSAASPVEITGSAWYAGASQARAAAAEALNRAYTTGAGSLELGRQVFREIPGKFWIAAGEVTRASWEAFLDDEPGWGPANREALMAQGLVRSDYLARDPANGGWGVPGVSWYAAEAYCRWFSSRLPPELAAWEVRLPTEAEWEYAAALAEEQPGNGAGFVPLEDLLGGYWEWCADPYAPLNFFPASAASIALNGSPERSLRGGAWVNPSPSVGLETRASLPPDFCSPFVSFRPVIAPREAPGE